MPGTTATEGLIGARELSLLPRGAIVVNVGRGSVVNEAALFAALQPSDGHLGGAGLDVWWNYPMLPGKSLSQGETVGVGPSSPSCPFHELPNVVLSPHAGQSSNSKASDRVAELVRMLEQMARTGTMPNRFDIQRGY